MPRCWQPWPTAWLRRECSRSSPPPPPASRHGWTTAGGGSARLAACDPSGIRSCRCSHGYGRRPSTGSSTIPMDAQRRYGSAVNSEAGGQPEEYERECASRSTSAVGVVSAAPGQRTRAGPVRNGLPVPGDRSAANRRSGHRCEGAGLAGAAHRLRSGPAQLVGAGFPAPRLLVPPERLGQLGVSAEALVPGGALLAAEWDSAARFAEALALLVSAAPHPATVSTLAPSPGSGGITQRSSYGRRRTIAKVT